MADSEQATVIDIRDLIGVLLNRLVWIILIAAVVAAGVWAYSKYFVTPEYKSTTTVYIYNDAGAERYSKTTVTTNELTAAQTLANTYKEILVSNSVLQQVIDQVGLNCTTGALKNSIEVSVVGDTSILRISVNNPDPETAKTIADGLAEVFPREIQRVVNAGGVEIIDAPNLPKAPYTPNVSRNTILGAAVGFVLAYALFVILELSNTVIRNDNDVQKEFTLPLLGSIPKIDIAETAVTEEKTDVLVQKQKK